MVMEQAIAGTGISDQDLLRSLWGKQISRQTRRDEAKEAKEAKEKNGGNDSTI